MAKQQPLNSLSCVSLCKKAMNKQKEQMPVRYKQLGCGQGTDFYFERSLDLIFSQGCFTVEIDHADNDVGLPVEYCGCEHYIVGTLMVTDNDAPTLPQDNRMTGQVLVFTPRENKETKIFTRTYSEGGWSEWRSFAYAGMFDKISTPDELLATVAGLVNENTRAKEVEKNVKRTAVDISSLSCRLDNENVTIIGKSMDGEVKHSIEIPSATTEKAGVMSAEDKTTLSSVDLNTYITNTLDSDNLINFEKPLYEGFYIGYGGVLSANSQFDVYLVPMNGKSITINAGGGFFLAATDKAGKITHVNSENANNNKVIEYLEGDVYALVSVPKSDHNTFVVRYVDTYIKGYTRYNTPVGINELEKLEEKCTDVYNVIKSGYNSKELLPAIAYNGKNITVSNNNVSINNNSYNNCYSYKVSFFDKRDYVKINTKTAISSIIGFNSSTSSTESPISVYKNIIGEVTLIITPDELGSNTHIWFACDKNVTPNVELFSFSQDEIVIPNNSIEPKAATFFNRNLFNIDDTDVIVGKYLTNTGSIGTNATLIISGFIPFNREMGKLLAVRLGNPNVYMGGAYCYYNANKEYIKGYNYSEKRIAEWEEGVAYVRFSLSNEDGQIIVVGDSVFPYMEYGDEKVNNRYISNQYCGVDAITETIGSIADGVTYELTKFPYHIKKNVGVSLSADLATMGTVIVGKGYNKYLGMWVEVDSTNVKVYKYENSASDIYTAEHGLDINTFVKVNLFLNNEGSLQIIIFSKGGCYKTSVEDCGYEMNYAPFVSCSGTSLSNVKLGASCADIRLPVWVFGDSYLGVTYNRWPGIIKDFGFFNVMFDGLAGITSTGIYAEVRKLLSMSIPKYIVWCLGMNDSTDDYKRIFDLVKQLCANIGVTMIATTIPTVPTRDKEAITNYVKSSGVRYIDMYNAVGATSTGSWHEGMLNSDGVHPDKLGAQALAMQVLTDFPEIMQY